MYEGEAALQLVCGTPVCCKNHTIGDCSRAPKARMRCGEADQPLEPYSSAVCQLVLSQAVLHRSAVSSPAWYSEAALSKEADISLVQTLSVSSVKSKKHSHCQVVVQGSCSSIDECAGIRFWAHCQASSCSPSHLVALWLVTSVDACVR